MANTERIKKILLNSIFEVFEKTFFVFLESSEKECTDYRWFSAIRFFGDIDGDLKVYFTKGIVDLMVTNMLNLEHGDVNDKLREDCVKEATNIICGDFLRQMDSAKVFDLSLPSFESFDPALDNDDQPNRLAVILGANEGTVKVVLTYRKGF